MSLQKLAEILARERMIHDELKAEVNRLCPVGHRMQVVRGKGIVDAEIIVAFDGESFGIRNLANEKVYNLSFDAWLKALKEKGLV